MKTFFHEIQKEKKKKKEPIPERSMRKEENYFTLVGEGERVKKEGVSE